MFWKKPRRPAPSRSDRRPLRPFPLSVERLEAREVLSASPYIVPLAAGVTFTDLLTVGDADEGAATNGYRMVGIPDGLGAFDNGNGTFTLLMNHELGPTSGIVRDHGSIGSFVSKFVIDKTTLEVISGDDQIQELFQYDTTTDTYVSLTDALNRLCSADLPEVSAYFNAATGKGTSVRIFMSGEETRPPFSPEHGRAFAHIVTGPDAGKTFELPRLGDMSFENLLANPFAQDKTIVVCTDDSERLFSSEGTAEPSEVYVYIGTKQSTGSEIDKAGLTNGSLFGVKVTDALDELDFTSGAAFTLHGFGDVSEDTTGTQLQTNSIANEITQFRRVEDGQWDPNDPSKFYFVTTDQFSGNCRLFRLNFTDITQPELGGTIDILIEGGAAGLKMIDNMTVDAKGRVLLQEDPGNNVHLARVWIYDIGTDSLTLAGQHDPAQFLTGAPGFITQDEESSGIIDVSHILGEGAYLLDVQAHANISATEPELVERGQLLLMRLTGPTAEFRNNVVTVLGTDGVDRLKVQITSAGDVVVKDGDTTVASFAGAAATLQGVTVNAYDGNDQITLDKEIEVDTFLRGGGGNDQIQGATGSDLILGDDGNDDLFGYEGFDVLLGGRGKDLLNAGKGSDLVIGGVTAFDDDPDGLLAVQQFWSAAPSYQDGIDGLRDGTPGVALTPSTVLDDLAKDQLHGQQDLDWFWGGVLDQFDKKHDEQWGPAQP